jgi:hypothetical protein
VPFFVISILIQVGLIVHVVKTGRNTIWIYVLAFVPLAGSLAYIIVELLPELSRSRAARRAKSGFSKAIDPDRDLRRANAEVEVSGNVNARRRLADELMERKQFDAAIEVYQTSLSGIFEHDPTLLLGLAQAQFGKSDFSAARHTLERLIAENPEYKSADGHLLYARALQEEGALDKAEQEFKVLASYYPGAEARVRYGVLLKTRGKLEAARVVLQELLSSAELAPRHYRKMQSEWLDRAKREMS